MAGRIELEQSEGRKEEGALQEGREWLTDGRMDGEVMMRTFEKGREAKFSGPRKNQ